MKRLLLAVLLGLTVARGTPSPRGQVANAAPGDREGPEVAKARGHFKAGEKAFHLGDFVGALAEFEAGYDLVPRPGFLLNMAHTERRLGHVSRARALYERYLEAEPDSNQRGKVLGLIADLDRPLGGPPSSSPSAPPPPSSPPSSPPPSFELDPDAARPSAPPPLPAAPEPRDEPTPVVSALPPARASEGSRSLEPSDSRPATPPVYRRWWFWAVLGAVAVGTTTAIVLGTPSNVPSFQGDGSLCRVGGP